MVTPRAEAARHCVRRVESRGRAAVWKKGCGVVAREGREECGQVYWVTRSMREPRERRCCGSMNVALREFSFLFSPLFPVYVCMYICLCSSSRRRTFHDAAESTVRSFDAVLYSCSSLPSIKWFAVVDSLNLSRARCVVSTAGWHAAKEVLRLSASCVRWNPSQFPLVPCHQRRHRSDVGSDIRVETHLGELEQGTWLGMIRFLRWIARTNRKTF